MSICKEIIDSTLKSYTPASFESLDMSEVIDIEDTFTVCCEGFIESLLDSALDSSREAINRKAQERINYFFEAVENDFSDREEVMKRLTVCYALIAGQGSSLMGWKRFMINHKHDTLKEANELYFKNWQGKAAISCK
jgi:hypothetical protein